MLLFLQPWEQLPKQGFWGGSGADSVLPCRDLQPCLSCSRRAVHCLHIPLTPAGAAGPTASQEPGTSSWIDPQGAGLHWAHWAPSLASPPCLYCQKLLSSATTSSQGSLCHTSQELPPPAVVWGVSPSCLPEPWPCQHQVQLVLEKDPN